MNYAPVVCLMILSLSNIAGASQITLNPCNQDGINEAVSQSNFGDTIYLNTGVYDLTDTVIIKSGIKLTGDPTAILRVSSSSSQWFKGSVGIISCKESLKDVEICNFQIDGNLMSLPASYANTAGHDKDCERCMILGGYTNDYAENISIHDMKLYNSFSDGMQLRFMRNVKIYNNFISNCQHEGLFLTCLENSEIYNNKIAGITSDCARLDNCVNCKVHDNTLFSYSGDNLNGAYAHGENGLQVGDAGSSHGYDASNKPTTTANIEVYGNTFANNGLKAITGSMGDNVYIHDNKFVGKEQLETMGIPVDISDSNPVSVERSEKVFSSIFDILNMNFSTTAFIPQYNQISSSQNWQKKGQNTEATLSIDGFRNISEIEGVEYIPGKAQDNVIVNYQTRNNAAFGAGQTSTISYEENNSTLTAYLTVTTSWYTKGSHSISIFGKRISVPTIKTESESEVYSASVQVPHSFPKIEDIKAEVIYYNNSYNPHSVVSLTNAWGIVQETYSYNGSEANHFKLIGEVSKKSNGLSYVNYSKTSMWKTTDKQIIGYGNELYISGKFNRSLLNISIETPYETVQIKEVNITEVPDESGLIFNPSLWAFVGTLSIFGFFIYRNLKRIIPKY